MMGTKIREFAPLPDLSLEELIPKDNFYRRLEERLDLSFIREIVEDLYAPSGRPSVDPVVFFKLELILFFEDLRSERQLMKVVADRLSLRWYLGYDLHEPLPDHSMLTRIRERYGLEIFRSFFDRIVEMCVKAGLVWGKELFFDSTVIKANAANESVVPRLTAVEDIEEHLSGLFEGSPEGTDSQPDEEHEDNLTSPDAALPGAYDEVMRDEVMRAANRNRRDWISENGRPDRTVRRGGYSRMSDGIVSRTDPDATHTGRAKGTIPPRLQRPLRRRWREGAHHPLCPGGTGRRQGQPAHARPALENLLPLEDMASPCHGGLYLRQPGEHKGRGGSRYPRLHAGKGLDPQRPGLLLQEGLPLRREAQPLCLPRRPRSCVTSATPTPKEFPSTGLTLRLATPVR